MADRRLTKASAAVAGLMMLGACASEGEQAGGASAAGATAERDMTVVMAESNRRSQEAAEAALRAAESAERSAAAAERAAERAERMMQSMQRSK